MRALLLLAVTGCVEIADDGGAWEPAASITGALAPELGPDPAQRDRVPQIRVATFNVHYGEDPAALAQAIRTSAQLASADVILVQEIEAYPEEGTSRAQRLAIALDMTWVYAPARVEGTGTHGLAILSRFPFAEPRVRRLPKIDQPLNARDRIALAAEVVVGASRISLVNIHLDTRIGPVDRVRQLAPAVEELADPVIAGGDLNTNPWAWFESFVPLLGTEAIVGQDQARIIDDYLAALGYAIAIPPNVATARVPAFTIRLDGLYPRGLALGEAGVDHVDGSDHWPAWVDVSVP